MGGWVFVNILRPRQNGRHIPDGIFKCIFSNENIKQYSSIGSDNDIVPARQQAIVWSNDGLFTDEYMLNSFSMS